METKTAKIIKDIFIERPVTLIDTEYLREGRANKLGCLFEIKTKIWLNINIPEYRVAIPENTLHKLEVLEHWDSLSPIEYKYIKYIPTGRVVYDSTKSELEAVVYEYRYKPN